MSKAVSPGAHIAALDVGTTKVACFIASSGEDGDLQVAIFTATGDKACDLGGADIQRSNMRAGGHSF